MDCLEMAFGKRVRLQNNGFTTVEECLDYCHKNPLNEYITIHPKLRCQLMYDNNLLITADPNVEALDKLHNRVTKPPQEARMVVTSNPQPTPWPLYLFL